MTSAELKDRFAAVCHQDLPHPGAGQTAKRHLRLFDVAAEDVSLAKLAEAHWDALAILAEAGRAPEPGSLYAVWGSETPGKPLTVQNGCLSGEKSFCSGFGLVDRALVTVGDPEARLLDVDVRPEATVSGSSMPWYPEAFRATCTGNVFFRKTPLSQTAVVGEPGFYLSRSGFWHGACGPAACWAGGAAGLLRYAEASRRNDPHTLAHLAGMQANVWAMRTLLEHTGHEIDITPEDRPQAQRRALTLRHLIEELASDILRRFGRAYGPYPLSMDEGTGRRFQETEILLRQSHGERDLEALARITARAIPEDGTEP